MTPIEVMRNRPTTRIGHDRFQPNHFVPDPLGLGVGENAAGWRGMPADVWPSPACWLREVLNQPSE